ncbi:hypothetical protein [Campylobacter sp. 7477a]|uniref:hypothetical protein n=1 Tax=Campylobacter sp. 7477a TaxID=2735741 RepID=UPI0030157E78|nr:hypothetical protein [Campylobacter sp. 7477a]
MKALKIVIDREKIVNEFGNITNFAKEKELNASSIFAILKKNGKAIYFQPKSSVKQTYDKLKELGYIISA